jgi:hypothetical protein
VLEGPSLESLGHAAEYQSGGALAGARRAVGGGIMTSLDWISVYVIGCIIGAYLLVRLARKV